MFGFIFLYKTNSIAVFFDPFPLGTFFPSILPRTNAFHSEQEDDLPAEEISEGFNNAKWLNSCVSFCECQLLGSFWDPGFNLSELSPWQVKTGNGLHCSPWSWPWWEDGSWQDLFWCCQPHFPNPTLSTEVIRWHDYIILGSADSATEQQLHNTEAAQNAFAPSHFSLLWSDPLLMFEFLIPMHLGWVKQLQK